jgi:hypothetical protein
MQGKQVVLFQVSLDNITMRYFFIHDIHRYFIDNKILDVCSEGKS